MPLLLIYAVCLFTLALIFYTWGIWSEFRAKKLQVRHARLFFMGVCVDTLGTVLTYKAIGGLTLTLHSILGYISLFLMAAHLIWAIIVLRQGHEKTLQTFHRLSLFVWSVWMISYLTGFVLGMAKL